MSDRSTTATVGEIVATDFRAAAVFEQFGIDACRSGSHSLTDACRTAAVDPDAVVRALEALPPPASGADDVTQWPVERLIDYIIDTHHGYVRSALPAITRYLAKLNDVRGARHPELARVAACFDGLRADFEQHMMKEEQVLFPYVRDIATRGETGGRTPSPFGTVEKPIRMMEREHREAAEAMETIRELTNGYKAPEDGCATYAVCMDELDRFERDLHRHVHLENNVLFPKAIELENGY